jgi:hypothetical protein
LGELARAGLLTAVTTSNIKSSLLSVLKSKTVERPPSVMETRAGVSASDTCNLLAKNFRSHRGRTCRTPRQRSSDTSELVGSRASGPLPVSQVPLRPSLEGCGPAAAPLRHCGCCPPLRRRSHQSRRPCWPLQRQCSCYVPLSPPTGTERAVIMVL